MIKSMSAQRNTLLLQFTFLFLPYGHYSLGFIPIKEGITPNPEQISYSSYRPQTALTLPAPLWQPVPLPAGAVKEAARFRDGPIFFKFFAFDIGDGMGIPPPPPMCFMVVSWLFTPLAPSSA